MTTRLLDLRARRRGRRPGTHGGRRRQGAVRGHDHRPRRTGPVQLHGLGRAHRDTARIPDRPGRVLPGNVGPGGPTRCWPSVRAGSWVRSTRSRTRCPGRLGTMGGPPGLLPVRGRRSRHVHAARSAVLRDGVDARWVVPGVDRAEGHARRCRVAREATGRRRRWRRQRQRFRLRRRLAVRARTRAARGGSRSRGCRGHPPPAEAGAGALRSRKNGAR